MGMLFRIGVSPLSSAACEAIDTCEQDRASYRCLAEMLAHRPFGLRS